ncbi:hypothetical protein Tco_1541356 [Tanacetum coccineum]
MEVSGSLKLNELPNLVTKLAERIRVLEDDLKKTKQTYSSAFTKLILRVKKLESIVKTGKARKRARVMLLEDEEDDSSKQILLKKDNQKIVYWYLQLRNAPINIVLPVTTRLDCLVELYLAERSKRLGVGSGWRFWCIDGERAGEEVWGGVEEVQLTRGLLVLALVV